MAVEIAEFLKNYPGEIEKLVNQTREFVFSSVPVCAETLHIGWKVISYGHRKKFCAIAPHSKWVNLQFHRGADLEDGHRLLQGAGKSMRHVRLETSADLGNNLHHLLEQASKDAQ